MPYFDKYLYLRSIILSLIILQTKFEQFLHNQTSIDIKKYICKDIFHYEFVTWYSYFLSWVVFYQSRIFYFEITKHKCNNFSYSNENRHWKVYMINYFLFWSCKMIDNKVIALILNLINIFNNKIIHVLYSIFSFIDYIKKIKECHYVFKSNA